jgi:hypothetical protein
VYAASAAHRGDGKIDAKDAAIIADQARKRRAVVARVVQQILDIDADLDALIETTFRHQQLAGVRTSMRG